MKIKNYTNCSLSEIQSNIKNKYPVMAVNRRNSEKMKDLIEELSSNKLQFRIFKQTDEGNREITVAVFTNGMETSRQTAKQRERLDALLIEEDDASSWWGEFKIKRPLINE
ncbi:hypothetical protein COL87_26155 [Bacillus pseudomycoides]|nr:hypothetical protein bpmyx0001_26690 [Bacillus pseudomycoides DSM 12442]OOR52172.1 hypothetical protein BLX05_11535 [Bacillus pseudomycoides]PDY09785.1 hypothetical protein COO16_25240 [Bacillus pseudomycoides]PEF76573.1 hypothetical protein CON94_04095 [Bacillus pseudomycoides]PEI40997.1 hypothetical protein CN641_24025 [Bacillus pseudomycoides]